MKSIIIIGLGTFGRTMAKNFIEDGHEVLAVEKDETRADDAADEVPEIRIGDACEERFMASLGIDNFDLGIVAIGDDFQAALEITVLLKDMGCKYVVARATKDVHEKLLRRNGADEVVCAEREMAERLATALSNDRIFDYFELSDDMGIYEISVPKEWVGKSTLELDVRKKYGISVVAIKRNEKFAPIPSLSHKFNEQERLMIMGSPEAVNKLK